MNKPAVWFTAGCVALGAVALRHVVGLRRERALVDAAASDVQTHLDLLTAVPNHEEHMALVHDAYDDLMDASDMPTLIAGLRQLRQVSRRAHALAVGADEA